MGPGVGPFPTIPHTAHRQTSSAVPRTRTRPIPMNNMKTSMLLLAALALPMLSACEGSGGSDAAKAEGGYATGKAVDTQGNPIAGAKILLDGTVFHNSYIHGSTGEDGTYSIKAHPGAWMAVGRASCGERGGQ